MRKKPYVVVCINKSKSTAKSRFRSLTSQRYKHKKERRYKTSLGGSWWEFWWEFCLFFTPWWEFFKKKWEFSPKALKNPSS